MNRTKRVSLPAAVIGAIAVLAVLVLPASAQLPITVEPLTPRSLLTDDVSGQLRIKEAGGPTTTINMEDLSRVVTARIALEPGAMFPWHTHSGPVLVTVAEGALVYINGEDCSERTYQAGEAFFDTGHGHVHSAVNRTAGVTVLYATFLQVLASGPLTLTEGVSAPTCWTAG